MIDGGEAIRKLALNVARFTGLAPLARSLVGGVGAILMLHRVTANPEKPLGVNRHLNIAPDFLDAVLTDMKARGYQFVTLNEAIERLRKGGNAGQFATITADDAYRDNFTEALPVLETHRAPLTIYVAPALISGDADLWWDVVDEIVGRGEPISLETRRGREIFDCSTPAKRFAANARLHEHLTSDIREQDQRQVLHALARSSGIDPDAPRRKTLMDWEEIRRIAAHPLVTIGAHTVHHYNLMRLDEETARRELTEAARILESEIGRKPSHMAYPYGYAGAVGAREVALAREVGYASAVTTRHGVLRAEHVGHLHALPRISVNGRYQRVAHIRTMLSGVTTPLANAGRMVVTV
jgi:peptidoglycan/xylan/chitin deacetylase (PgdA/CDA1 family)